MLPASSAWMEPGLSRVFPARQAPSSIPEKPVQLMSQIWACFFIWEVQNRASCVLRCHPLFLIPFLLLLRDVSWERRGTLYPHAHRPNFCPESFLVKASGLTQRHQKKGFSSFCPLC